MAMASGMDARPLPEPPGTIFDALLEAGNYRGRLKGSTVITMIAHNDKAPHCGAFAFVPQVQSAGTEQLERGTAQTA